MLRLPGDCWFSLVLFVRFMLVFLTFRLVVVGCKLCEVSFGVACVLCGSFLDNVGLVFGILAEFACFVFS